MWLVQACSAWRAQSRRLRRVTLLYTVAAVYQRTGRSEGVLQKIKPALQPWQPQRTRPNPGPKPRPNLLNFSSVAWLGTYAPMHAAALSVAWASTEWLIWWEVILKAIRYSLGELSIGGSARSVYVTLVLWIFFSLSVSSVVNVCRPRGTLVTPWQSELQFKCHGAWVWSAVTEEFLLEFVPKLLSFLILYCTLC